jgi:hypothetical protein
MSRLMESPARPGRFISAGSKIATRTGYPLTLSRLRRTITRNPEGERRKTGVAVPAFSGTLKAGIRKPPLFPRAVFT